jgi:arylformamidase
VRIHDISRPLEAAAACFPGDEPFSLRWTMRLAEGATVNLSAWSGSPHAATHVDAPLHVVEGGAAVDEIDLAPFLGPARVLDASPGEDGLVPATLLEEIDPASPPRLLLRTGTHPDSRRWPRGFAALSPALVERFARGGGLLVGIDTPSVDPEHSKTLPAHHALIAAGISWLENLDLSGVSPGVYTLVALPLRAPGADASPVRAVLLDASLG